ncbi:MAG: ECF-type sigma factor [Phycisphaerales bacterium]
MASHSEGQLDAHVHSQGVDSFFVQFESELRGLASAVFSGQDASHTLQPTALISEAWLKLAGNIDAVESRQQFFALAARVMRQVLIDHARSKNALKRGGIGCRVTFDESQFGDLDAGFEISSLNDALTKLETLNRRHAEIVELRLLGMLTISEIAGLTGVSERTVKRDWQAARLWLINELREQ